MEVFDGTEGFPHSRRVFSLDPDQPDRVIRSTRVRGDVPSRPGTGDWEVHSPRKLLVSCPVNKSLSNPCYGEGLVPVEV